MANKKSLFVRRIKKRSLPIRTYLTRTIISHRELKKTILANIKLLLYQRSNKPRSSADDNIFSYFNNSVQGFIKSGNNLGSLGIDIFMELEKLVLSFELSNNTQLHKGSIYFNAGLCFIWQGDFDRALFYWIKADKEDQQTYKKSPYDLFFSDIFNQNYGASIKDLIIGEIAKESNIYELLAAKIFYYPEYEAYIKGMDDYRISNMMINFFRRIWYDSIDDSPAMHLLYYRLVGDYCIMFESSLKKYLRVTDGTLGNIARSELTNTRIGNIGSVIDFITRGNNSPSYQCNSVSSYNSILKPLLSDINSETSRLQIAGKVIHLITITRNQVVHNFDTNNIIYGDIFLCQKIIRLIIIAQIFDNYI